MSNKRNLVILGAGTAGTMTANRLRRRLDSDDWTITVVDQSTKHYYQPGFLFLPFATYRPRDVVRPTRRFLPRGVELVVGPVESIEPEEHLVRVADRVLGYDQLVIATGTTPRPDQTLGLDGPAWRDTVHDFYTFDGAVALADRLSTWNGGRLVVNVMETPIKCPVAPLEFAFLADAFFRDRGMRDRVELVYATPLDGAFTKPVANRHLSHLLADRKIDLVSDFYVEEVDGSKQALVAYDGRDLPYDLLVTVPVNMGADAVAAAGLGDELNHVPVDRHTLLAEGFDNIFALGDAAAIPTSKAGSVVHFEVDAFVPNFLRHVQGLPMVESFDGRANCFIESGGGKALMIDFDYENEPLPGRFPFSRIGPFRLLEETKVNHWGKLGFRWAYWHALMRGRRIPLPAPRRPGRGLREE